MSNILPNIFKGKASRDNNQESSVINSGNVIDKEIKSDISVNKQINDVFNSENFVYK